MSINLWNKKTNGIDKPVVNQKRKLWFEFVPGIAFPAVTFGRQRKRWFKKETEYLIIYRFDIFKECQCHIKWIPESMLLERYDK